MQRELGYLVVAGAAGAFVLAPSGLHDFPLDPRLVPVSVGFAVLWTGFRLGRFVAACRRWQRWRRSPPWSFEAADLPFEGACRRLPRGLAWQLYRLLAAAAPPDGPPGVWDCLAAGLTYRPWLSHRTSRWLGGRVYRDRGVFLGRAFRWSRGHTQELEDYLHRSSASLPTGRDGRGGYPALYAVGLKDEQPLVLPWSELVGHVLVGGTTRSGKTRLLEIILCEAIRGPGTVIVMDPKGDRELLVRTASQARRLGHPFAFFSPAFPAESASFNPFSACENTTELAERVQVLMPGGGRMANDPFFVEYPLAFVQHVGEAQQALGEDWTIERLNALTTLEPPFERLIARYLHEVILDGDGDPEPLEKLVEAYEALTPEARGGIAADRLLVADKLVEARRMEREHFQKVTANLVPAFRGVSGGDMDRLLSSDAPDLTWEGIVANRTVVYFSMNSLMYGEVANRIGRVILQDLIGFLGRRYAYDGAADMSPLTVLIDEFSNVAYGGFIDALNKGGGAKAQFMLAMQSLADPEAAMGRDGTQRVLDNLNTRVWFRLTDDATAKLATEGLGLTTIGREDISHSLSYGGERATSGGARGAMAYAQRPLVRPEWVTALPRGEAFVRSRGENWKLRVPMLAPVGERELRAITHQHGLHEVLGNSRKAKRQARMKLPVWLRSQFPSRPPFRLPSWLLRRRAAAVAWVLRQRPVVVAASWLSALRKLVLAIRRLLQAFRQPPGHGVPVVPAMPGSAPERPGIFSMDEEIDEAGMETLAGHGGDGPSNEPPERPDDTSVAEDVDEETLEGPAGHGVAALAVEDGGDDSSSGVKTRREG